MRSLLIIAIVVFIVGGVVTNIDFLQSRLSGVFSRSETEWNTYTSEAFGFSVLIPADWVVVEFPNDEIAPRVNMYSARDKQALSFTENGIERTRPIDHHSFVPNVSVFPHGIPTEGFFGESAGSEVSFFESARIANDFVLKDGSRFATFVSFADMPENWSEAGFVWSYANVRWLRTQCFREGVRVAESKCDPLSGDTIVHRGYLNTQEREIQKAILSSFKFLKSTTTL